MNVPELRFKEFTNDYKKYKYKDVLKIKSGRDQKQIMCSDGKYPILGTGGIIGKTNNFLYNKPSVLIGRKGTIDKPQYMETPFWTVDTLFYSEIFSKNNPKYIYYSFQNVNWKKYDESTGVPSLSCSTIENIDCFIPNIEEQTKIANFLSLLDKKIELQTKKIEDLKLYKKELLMNLFKDRTCNKKLSQCFSFGKAGGTPKSTNQDYYNGNIPFLSISDMSEQGKYIFKTEKSITELGINNSSAWLVPKNSIIISMYASYGLVSINNIELSTSQAMFNIIITEDNSVEYIYYYLYYLYITNFYDSIVSTGTQPNLNAKQLKNLKIYIPPKAEQEKMSNKLIKFDNKLNLEIIKLTKLQELKKGLMQNMFV